LTLREYRFSKSLSQEVFAKKLGYSREAITLAEKKNRVSQKMLFRLRGAFPDFEKANVLLEVENGGK
jgi:transcriptional regulator with XRE-family HTH domain